MNYVRYSAFKILIIIQCVFIFFYVVRQGKIFSVSQEFSKVETLGYLNVDKIQITPSRNTMTIDLIENLPAKALNSQYRSYQRYHY